MGVMRARLIGRLREADRFARLRLYHPIVPGLGASCVNVHAKVMVVDDALARVGSSNLSNRSMGLDTECDLALDAGAEPRLAADIAGFRDRLLGEHLGAAPAEVAAARAATGSLIGAVDRLRGGPRSLEPLPVPADDAPTVGLAILDGLVCDPERPAPDRLIEDLVPTELRRPVNRSLLGWGLALAGLFALVAAWRLTPLPSLLNVEHMAALGRGLRDHPAAPLLVLGGYAAGALVLFPITLLLAATALVFDPAHALAYGMGGALAGAALTYGIGRLAMRFRARWLQGPRVSRIRAQLQRRGTLAVVAARLLPVGNFSVINIVAGALGIRFREFMLGNAIGLLPGLLGLTLLSDRLGRVLREPRPLDVAALAALLIAVFAVFAWLRRRLGHHAAGPPRGPS
jgi:uncharacterized membrane protein YdjX (TVP38/TMEM64 family)